MPRNNWSREELIIALNLYFKIPFGKMHKGNPDVIGLAKILGRTPSAIALKLVNFASFDPLLKKRNISGASHTSKLDKEIWNEFSEKWEYLGFESENLLANKSGKKIEEVSEIDVTDLPVGRERESIVKSRVNQSFFRKAVLAAYDIKCCITGLAIPELLTASHIVPWSKDVENRLNPRNGLCLNAFHDRAFDRGLITITPELSVKISTLIIKKTKKNDSVQDFLLRYDGVKIAKPERFQPNIEFIKYHNDIIFKK